MFSSKTLLMASAVRRRCRGTTSSSSSCRDLVLHGKNNYLARKNNSLGGSRLIHHVNAIAQQQQQQQHNYYQYRTSTNTTTTQAALAAATAASAMMIMNSSSTSNNYSNDSSTITKLEKEEAETATTRETASTETTTTTDPSQQQEEKKKAGGGIPQSWIEDIPPDDEFYNVQDIPDEETHCELCLTFRQGPCRIPWKRFELCEKSNQTKGDKKNSSLTEEEQAAADEARKEKCMKYVSHFIRCHQDYNIAMSFITREVNEMEPINYYHQFMKQQVQQQIMKNSDKNTQQQQQDENENKPASPVYNVITNWNVEDNRPKLVVSSAPSSSSEAPEVQAPASAARASSKSIDWTMNVLPPSKDDTDAPSLTLPKKAYMESLRLIQEQDDKNNNDTTIIKTPLRMDGLDPILIECQIKIPSSIITQESQVLELENAYVMDQYENCCGGYLPQALNSPPSPQQETDNNDKKETTTTKSDEQSPPPPEEEPPAADPRAVKIIVDPKDGRSYTILPFIVLPGFTNDFRIYAIYTPQKNTTITATSSSSSSNSSTANNDKDGSTKTKNTTTKAPPSAFYVYETKAISVREIE